MKKLYIYLSILSVILGCTANKSDSIEISSNSNWLVIDKNIHVYISAEVNPVLIKSEDKTVLINPGSGSEIFDAIKSYTTENKLKITDLLVTSFDQAFSDNLNLYKNDNVKYHSISSLENKNELLIGKLKLGVLPVYDYGYKAGLGYSIDERILISGGMIEADKAFRFSSQVPETESLINLKNHQFKLIIPGSGKILQEDQIEHYFDERIGTVKYHVNTDNTDFLQVNDNIFVFTSTDLPAREFNATIITSGSDAAIFDTGTANSMAVKMKDFITDRNLRIGHIFLTHDHYDHIGNLEIFETPGVQVHRWQNSREGEEVKMGEHLFRITYSDGHTPKGEHISIEMNNEILISGDILVANVKDVSILLTDANDMKETLKRFKSKSYKLIIPGHRGVLLDNKLIDLYLSSL
ncbi:MAG: MBL fold metallo-hydrolase [Spirochaetales bacterium]|nr:MBL fold metallo-hydrolase [Spirochaetales bacterium]